MALLCCPSIGPLEDRKVKAFPASIGLIKQLVGVLVRKQSRGVHSRLLCSQRFPRAAVGLFKQCCPCPLSVS